jgi:hypothetical protein
MSRFFLDQDQSSHWYVVPEEIRAKWQAWCELDEDNPEAWEAPEGAIRMDGAPHRITFENWKERE